MAPFSFIASAILSLAGAFTLQTTERLFNDKFALRPDQNGHCHLRSSTEKPIPYPSREPVPTAFVIGIVVAVLSVFVLIIAVFVWRHRVRIRIEGPQAFSSASWLASPEKTPPLANRSSSTASFAMYTVMDIESGEAVQGEKNGIRT